MLRIIIGILSVVAAFSPDPSLYNRQCLRCVLTAADKRDFTLSNFNNLQQIQPNNNYYCTFDQSCRPSRDKAPFRSCEQGISACLLYANNNVGAYATQVGIQQDQLIRFNITKDKVTTI